MGVGGGEGDGQAASLQACSGRALDEATGVPQPAAYPSMRLMEDLKSISLFNRVGAVHVLAVTAAFCRSIKILNFWGLTVSQQVPG